MYVYIYIYIIIHQVRCTSYTYIIIYIFFFLSTIYPVYIIYTYIYIYILHTFRTVHTYSIPIFPYYIPLAQPYLLDTAIAWAPSANAPSAQWGDCRPPRCDECLGLGGIEREHPHFWSGNFRGVEVSYRRYANNGDYNEIYGDLKKYGDFQKETCGFE